MPWSRMFGIMELAKREKHVEDYSISQTTLEQIFLQFTKYQQQGDEGTAQAAVNVDTVDNRPVWKRIFTTKFYKNIFSKKK